MANKRNASHEEEIEKFKKKLKETEDENIKLKKQEKCQQTIEQIEKFQNRTADAEEKALLYKYLTNPVNKSKNTEMYLDYLNNGKGDIKIMKDEYILKTETLLIPGKSLTESGIKLFSEFKFHARNDLNKCIICSNKDALYSYNDDIRIFPFKLNASIDKCILIPKDNSMYEGKF